MTETTRGTIPEHDFAMHEHHDLTSGLNQMIDVGTRTCTYAEMSVAVLDVLHWVDMVLVPHAEWEDRWLYDEIDRRAGTPWATKLMRFEHDQIRAAASELATARAALHASPSNVRMLEVRGRLFRLEGIIRAHMAREERYLIPLLDGTSPVAAAAVGC